MISTYGFFILGCITLVASVPFREPHASNVDTTFIGKGTNEIATALLQGYVEKEENMAYSPFGYSAILAVFSEGARGASREEIATALRFPADVSKVREAYKVVLERFVAKKFSNTPEFKNWFYVYKNYTVREELQNVLRNYYLTEVKVVDRPEDYIKGSKKSPIQESMDPDQKIAMEMSKVPDVQGTDTKSVTAGVKNEKMDQQSENMKTSDTQVELTKNSVMQEEKAQSEEKAMMEKMKDEKKMESSEPENVKSDDTLQQEKQKMSEKSSKTEEMKKEEEMPETEKLTEVKETSKIAEEPAPMKADPQMNLTPVEHFSGMTDSSIKIRGQESTPRMVIFNGLYYKGEWEMPFIKKPADDSRVFYKSEKEKIFVSTINSEGVFNFGNIANLDCRAIELPYKGGRYSLLILVPNTRDGLTKLISDLSGYSFTNIYDQMTEKLVDVCLPTFDINTISKPISSLKKLGLNKISSIFSPEKADLSGISVENSGLYVEELVQMVTFKVDAEYSKANFLTASIASSRSNIQNFHINQPFLFYLRDNVEDIIIVNGKVIDPTPKPLFYFS